MQVNEIITDIEEGLYDPHIFKAVFMAGGPGSGTMEDGYLEGRLGLIIDGTGRDVTKIAKAKEKLMNMGYSCMMVFVNTSLDIAQERNLDRERVLPADEVSSMWNAVQNNIMKFQQLFGASKFQVVDNNGGLEDPDRAENFKVVEKNITAFISRPPSNRYAKAWIENEQKKKSNANNQ